MCFTVGIVSYRADHFHFIYIVSFIAQFRLFGSNQICLSWRLTDFLISYFKTLFRFISFLLLLIEQFSKISKNSSVSTFFYPPLYLVYHSILLLTMDVDGGSSNIYKNKSLQWLIDVTWISTYSVNILARIYFDLRPHMEVAQVWFEKIVHTPENIRSLSH